jgi:hypothetical protein
MPIRTAGCAALIILAAAVPANAQDAERFAERIEAVYGFMGSPLDLGAPTSAENGVFVFENASVTVEDLPPLGFSIRFEGVEETADGGFTAERFEVEGFTADLGTIAPLQRLELSLDGIIGEDIAVPAEGESVDDTLRLSQVVEAGRLAVRVNGAEVFSVETMRGAITSGITAGEPIETIGFEYFVGPMRIDLVAMDSNDAKTTAKRIGRLALESTLTMTGSWGLSDGLFSLDEFSIDAPGFGRLDMPGAILGFDRQLMADIYAAQAASLEASQRNDQQAYRRIQTELGLKMVELRLVSAGLGFFDDGLVSTVFGIEARNNDISVDEARERMTALAVSQIAGFNLGSFGDDLADRVADFLAEPDSIEVSVEPREPLRFTTLAGAIVYPPGLINLLSPTIR